MSREYDILASLFDANQKVAFKKGEVDNAKAALKLAETERDQVIRIGELHVNKKRGNPLELDLEGTKLGAEPVIEPGKKTDAEKKEKITAIGSKRDKKDKTKD